ncbi:MAG: shikimate dehydrogenase family protein [Gemmatimonadota bacterium]
MPISAATRTFALLGEPVEHSRSPQIQNAAIKAAGIDAVYVALRCGQHAVPGLIGGLARAGGGGNVTIPHKGVAADVVDIASQRVRATSACNTFWLQRGKVHGENTDVAGFSRARALLLPDLHDARVLIIGSGGGARSVLYSLLDDGAAGVTVLGRKRARSQEITAVAGRRARRVAYITNERLLRNEGFDLVVNATSLGLRATDRFPLHFSRLAALRAVFDLVYQPGGTRWVQQARALGIPAADGAEMLIQQAAAAFEIWFDVEAPVAVMRAAFG